MTQNNIGIYASQISGHLYGGPYGAYDSLASVTLSATGATTIDFAGIPTGYKHLQFRIFSRANPAQTTDQIGFRLNGDTTSSNYVFHELNGNGSTATSGGYTSTSPFMVATTGGNSTTGMFGAGIVDILDYSNTNKYKTLRSLTGHDQNGSGLSKLCSGLWLSTNAITSITLFNQTTGPFVSGSSFALYGVK